MPTALRLSEIERLPDEDLPHGHVDNAASYAQAGADILVSSAPYWAPPRDVAVTLAPA